MRGPTRVLVLLLAALLATGLTGCTLTPPQTSGLQLSGFDRNVRPQDDLFEFVNGGWVRDTTIPPDRSRYGSFEVLGDKAEADVRAIIEQIGPAEQPGSEGQKIADLYASFLDEPRLESLGATPLAGEFTRIDALAGPADLVGYLGHQSRLNLPSPIALNVGQDARNAEAYVLSADQGGLSLPDREYYLSAEPRYETIRQRFGEYAGQMLQLAGVADAAALAPRILALETRLAGGQWTKVQLRDPVATYNRFAVADAPGLDWRRYLEAAEVPASELVIGQPSFFTALGSALTQVPLADWKAYLKLSVASDYAPYLSAPFVTAAFEFFGRQLEGRQEQTPRWKRGVRLVEAVAGEAVGRRYVERHFSPDSKARMDRMVGDLIATFRSSIDTLDWMSEPTKEQARDKLAKLSVKIGYPDRWKDYAALEVRRDDLVGNVERAADFEHRRAVAKLGQPVDRGEWLMTPQTVNAYYNPSMNEIVFPAAILQPPFFDAAADDAANYGGIGAVIGHEISHAFDDQGRKYDGTGNLRDWWAPEDQSRFTERTAGLVAQYSAYSPLAGTAVNGQLTLGENIADVVGLGIAFKAYRLSLDGRPAPEIDGFTGEQRFFLGWAQGWRQAIRDDALRKRLLTDPHSPAQYRTNGPVVNLPSFHEAFGIGPQDKMFKPPEQRVTIW